MNDLGTPPPDWDSIFQQARRRMAGKLLLVAVLAAGGTMLLLGGGLQAQGAISLPVPGMNGNHRDDGEKHEKQVHRRHHHEQEDNRNHGQDKHKKQTNDNKPNHPPKPCTEKTETSSEGEYGRWEVPNGPAGNKCPSGI